MTAHLPMFPLGRVLLPGEVLPLHVFEPRYRALMEHLTASSPPGEFGVVLIERGHEVGGGDQRTSSGTSARLLETRLLPDGRWLAAALGTRRFRVSSWLEDAPYPQAMVDEVVDPPWDHGDDPLLSRVESEVRAAVSMAAELGESGVPAGFRLSSDPIEATWELCALAPVTSLDRQGLLDAPDPRARLEMLSREVADAAEILAFRMGGA